MSDLAPTTPVGHLREDEEVTFLPLETVWPDSRYDSSRLRPAQEVLSGYTRFAEGDVLVPKITPTFEAARSVIAHGLRDGLGFGTTELHVLRPGPRLDVRFLWYRTLARDFIRMGTGAMIGVAGQKRVPLEFVKNFEFELPPLEEQQRIVNFLDKEIKRLEEVTALHHRLHVVLAERERSVILNALGSVSAPEWPLRRIASFVGGTGFPHRFQGLSSGDFPFIKVSDMHRPGTDVWVSDAENWITKEVAAELGAQIVPEGSVIFPKIGAAMLKNPRRLTGRPCVIDNNTLAVVPHQASPRFLRYALLLVDFAELANPGPVPSLNTAAAAALKVKLPDPREQDAIADLLDLQLDCHRQLRSAIEAQTELLDERREALITSAVQGTIDAAFSQPSGMPA